MKIGINNDRRISVTLVYMNVNAWDRDCLLLLNYIESRPEQNCIIIGEINAIIGKEHEIDEFILNIIHFELIYFMFLWFYFIFLYIS